MNPENIKPLYATGLRALQDYTASIGKNLEELRDAFGALTEGGIKNQDAGLKLKSACDDAANS